MSRKFTITISASEFDLIMELLEIALRFKYKKAIAVKLEDKLLKVRY